MKVLFGPAGNSDSFSKEYKSSKNAPLWLKNMGLSAYEYQCGRGVNIGEITAKAIGDEAKAHGIQMSLHAPYFINLSSAEPERIEKNIRYVLESAKCIDVMGGRRIVIHMGGLSKMTREEAMANTKVNVTAFLKALDENNLSHIIPCIETMGKINVLGTLEEVLEICKMDERLLPCIDFGHINARTHGSLKNYEDFAQLFDMMENAIGKDRAKVFHSHFSKIEYSKGGEVKHLTFEDETYGPVFDHIAKIIKERDYAPTFICESAGTQAEDALIMKKIYENT
ncbi:MAG: TIM barrel protein [Clostridia bacterium]|nr:TIM barrel protein [Clostridia bacterium]